jgi:hypothetical protein
MKTLMNAPGLSRPPILDFLLNFGEGA